MIRRWIPSAYLLLCLFNSLPAQETAAAPNPKALLDRIQDLDTRLQRAEALIRELIAERQDGKAASTALEAAVLNPAPKPAPEVTRSQDNIPAKPALMPQELLPNLGQIGAATSFSAGRHLGIYSGSGGSFFQGAVELPLLRAPGGKVLYEFSAGLISQQSPIRITSNVAQVANLALLGPGQLQDALRGIGSAPFPVSINATTDLSLLQVSPFTLKYRFNLLDRFRLRPYALLGFGTYVTISSQNSVSGLRPDANLSPEQIALLRNLFGNGAPFGGSLIGGQIAASPEVSALGIPSGQGAIHIGLLSGAGVEWRIRPRFSLGVDYRFHRLGSGFTYSTIAPRGALHF